NHQALKAVPALGQQRARTSLPKSGWSYFGGVTSPARPSTVLRMCHLPCRDLIKDFASYVVMAEATTPRTGGEVLTPNDAVKVLEELLPAQNQSYELGLRLNLKPHDVKSIHATVSEPRKRLLEIVLEFLNQVEPRPTWRVIVDALKSPAVSLPQLAMAVEAAQFPDTTPQLPAASVSSSQSPATSTQPGLSSPLHGSGASVFTEVDYQSDLPQPS
ncbi:hypothetical protein GBAR_LOCUS12812, partial [Geodia barretti]